MSDTEQKNFGQLLAYHTAPTLLGIKCASLVSLPRTEYDVDAQSCYFNRRTAAKGLNSRVLCGCGGRVLLLVYNEAMAKAIAEGAGAELFSVTDFSGSILDYEAVAFGCPAVGAETLEDAKFEPFFTGVEGKLFGKEVALFGSYGWGDGE